MPTYETLKKIKYYEDVLIELCHQVMERYFQQQDIIYDPVNDISLLKYWKQSEITSLFSRVMLSGNHQSL